MGTGVCAKNPLTQTPVNALGSPYPEVQDFGYCLYPTPAQTVFSAVFPYKFVSFGFSSQIDYQRLDALNPEFKLKSAFLAPILNVNLLERKSYGEDLYLRIGYQRDFFLENKNHPFFATFSTRDDFIHFQLGVQGSPKKIPCFFISLKYGYLTLLTGFSYEKLKGVHIITDLPLLERYLMIRLMGVDLHDLFRDDPSESRIQVLIVGTFKR